ncbi:MAG: hypothetical protein PVF57_19765, partial [Pseudomonadales bacterium]
QGSKTPMSPDAQLEQLLKVFVDRFGASRTLGEAYAITYGLRVWREGGQVTLADVAEHTGIPKQNLSRWLKSRLEAQIVQTEPHDTDARMHQIKVVDIDDTSRHLAAAAEILGCAFDPPRRP